MREALEDAAASFTARHISQPELEALYDILEAEKQVIEDPKAASKLNKSFHTALAHAAHNRYLLDALDSLGLAIALLGLTALSLPERKQNALAEHQAILDAITKNDTAGAGEAAKIHIRKSHRARLQLLLETELG
ncbi:GntR family transcriptional regulator [Pseudaestuariivita rosea]|uniref:GntR family transcriptional regulator n=1 Tax=Pseudaestuariivita rosea TaxID=2763263 RepID=UPI001ABA5CE8|nr:FCD domain-containing protein [Pseudaestuariivita rosea]